MISTKTAKIFTPN